MVLAMAVSILGAGGAAPGLSHAQQVTGFALTESAASQKTRKEGTVRAQENIALHVRHELVMLPYYSVFDNLEYRVEGYTVTLSGQVVRPTLKSDAEARVKKIEGVEQVVNRIEVLPASFHDDRIRRATYRAIFGHSSMSRYAIQPVPPIHIIVKRGHVRLVGVVANEADRNIAYIQARGVPGAFSVTNELRVERRG
jgi:hyperosmotically inducible protein